MVSDKVVVEDSQPSSDTDEGDSHENDAGTQIGDPLEVSSITAPDRRGGDCPIDIEDVIDSDAVGKAKTQMSGLPRRKLSSTQPMSSSKMNIEQPTQGRTPTIENTSSSSSSDTDDDHNDDRGNHTAWLTRKRKRLPPTKQHILSSNTTSKQRLKHNVRSAKQRRLPPSGGRPFSNRPLALKPLSAPPYSGYGTKICYSDDSSDDSSGNRVRHLESTKRPVSTVRPYRPRKYKRKRSQGTADEDDEYEVEKILNARVHRKNYSTVSNG